MRPLGPRLTTALLCVFKPLARLLLKQGIGAKPIVDLVKAAFVEVATEDYGKRDRVASVTRVSELTGLGRKEVSKIRDAPPARKPMDELFGLSEGDVLHAWYTSPRFVDDDGLPKPLQYGPGEESFCELVSEVLTDRSPAYVLDELLESGSVSMTDDGNVLLLNRERRVHTNLPQILGEGLGSLANTMDKNWGNDPATGLIQRVVYSTQMSQKNVDIVRRAARVRVTAFIKELDDYFAGYETDTSDPFFDRSGNELIRVGVGAHYFEIEK